jgi:tetratricopeptide (TPR) repeat protein
MSKSMVEKYEQMLNQDPTSTVFVELARAYLDKGENDKAIEVCKTGCEHHPSSVVGRVLWGKGLINSGKAAEAMKQFDAAVNIDRENPHAYNLISEVLLRKGLYRSALPILRKASTLQPNDARIKQWLEQARAAVSGGPAPILGNEEAPAAPAAAPAPPPPAVEPVTKKAEPAKPRSVKEPAPQAEHPSADPDVFAAFTPGKVDPRAEPTVLMQAYEGAGNREAPTQTTSLPEAWPSAPRSMAHKPGPPVPTTELPAVVVAQPDDGRPTMEFPAPSSSSDDLPVVVGERTSTAELPTQTAVPSAPDPFDALKSSRTESTETFRGLTSTFQALEEAQPAPLPLPLPPPPPAPSLPEMQSVIPAAELVAPSAAGPDPSKGQGLLDEVVSAQSEMPTSEFQLPGMKPAPKPAPKREPSGGLLEEIPDSPFESSPSGLEPQRVEFSTQATEAIAKEYERELREKLQAKQQQKTFLQKHGLKLGVGALVTVVALALVGSFIVTRQKHGGENLESALAKGLVAINADTKEQYALGLQSLELALTMDESNATALANIAMAKAILYAEHGGALSDREAAKAAIDKPRVREVHPEIALVVDYLTADANDLPGHKQQLLSNELNQSVVEALAGRVLLADKRLDDAFKHLQKATELNGRNLRALVSLGEYYLAAQDYERAAQILSTAETLSKFHPQRVMGLAEARLELAKDPSNNQASEALSDLEAVAQNASIPEVLKGRFTLLLGRTKSTAGKHDEAFKTLTDGLATYTDQTFDFQLALGMAGRHAGRMADAQKAYDDALKARPKDEEAKEGLGRVLLARSREKELLDRVKPDGDQRKVALVRGIAAARLEDGRRARAELDKTRVNGKYPAEAVVYLALLDAADEGGEKAQQALEKLVSTTKRNKATAQIALARIYMKRNLLTEARQQLEDAARDPQDYEANALLGQLYLEAGVPPETALPPLQKAVERNGSHSVAHHLLSRTYLALGQFQDATKQVEAWTADNPASEDAWTDAAFVFLHTGRMKDAEAAVAKGVRNESTDALAFRVKAQVLFARGDTRNAFPALERSNQLNKKDAETFCEIGNAFVRQGNGDTALKAYEAARRENPKSLCGAVGPHHVKPAPSRGQRPTPKEELIALQKTAFAVWDKAFVDATLARVLLEERDLKNAVDAAESATRTDPYSAVAWFAAGEVARKQKVDAKAREAYGKAAELDQSWAQARLAYADALLKAGGDDADRALPEYEAVLILSQNEADLARVKKLVTQLKKK